MSAAITFSAGVTRARLEVLAREAGGSRELMGALGQRAVKTLRTHFTEKDRTGNSRGWKRSHFWSRRIRANTALTEVTERSATVTIAAPEMAQKIHGGRITPKEAKNLALPARAEAAGIAPGMFTDLKFIPIKGRGELSGMLVQQGSTKIKFGAQRKDGTRAIKRDHLSAPGGLVFYWLFKSVTQEPDPTALPSSLDMERALTAEASDYFATVQERKP